jgi:transposase
MPSSSTKTLIGNDQRYLTLYVSLEMSPKSWLVTSLLSGTTRMSKRQVKGGDSETLLGLLKSLRLQNCGSSVKIAVIQEVGMEGFWLHRLLENAGIESWLVDPGSIATSRRSRRVKTNRIDGEALIRVLMAFKRGEPRVGSMVVPPSPAEEDRRRIGRERRDLLGKRVEETNKIRGLLFTHGVREFDPLANISRQNLDKLRTGDGRAFTSASESRIIARPPPAEFID